MAGRDSATYEPGEDSSLLLRAAEAWLIRHGKAGMKILDMGAGSGYIIANIKEWMGRRGLRAELWASDIDDVKLPKGIRFVRSDLFGSMAAEEKFDLVLFNPPYLPEAPEDRHLTPHDFRQLVGGRRGNELSIMFLKQLPCRLSQTGACLLLTSSASHPEEIISEAERLGFGVNIADGESFPFERLRVFLITRRRNTLRKPTH